MQDLGARLKKIRLERGISLEEVHKKTKIQLNILKAIEGDSLTSLSPVYLRSFVRLYCRYLAVPEEECNLESRQAPKKQAFAPRQAVAPVISKLEKQEAGPGKKEAKGMKPAFNLSVPKLPWKQIAVIVAACIVLFLFVQAIAAFGRFVRSRPKPAPMPKKIEQPAAKKEEKKPAAKLAKSKATVEKKTTKAAAVERTQEETPKAASKQASADIRLGIRAKENCYIVLKADGQTVFQRVLAKGRYESWRAKDKMELSVANAAAVELEVNGSLFTKIGRKGQAIKNIVITKDGMRIP